MIHEEYIRFKSPGHLSVQVSDIIKSDRAKWTGITLELTFLNYLNGNIFGQNSRFLHLNIIYAE